jgi:hypothetical protein
MVDAGTECQSIITLHLGYLAYNMYLANLTFLGRTNQK